MIAGKLNLYVPFEKIDKEQRLVYGWASTPCMDLQDEIVTIDAIKAALPEYLPWGNIREMHQPSAIGVCKHAEIIEGGDKEKEGLFIGAKIVDNEAWEKICEGVYKGWSIGGERLEKIGDKVTKLKLYEISAVDRPANPECRFSYTKAVGLESGLSFDRGEVAAMAGIIAKLAKDGVAPQSAIQTLGPIDTITQDTGLTWYDLGDGNQRQILNLGGQFHTFKRDGTLLGSDKDLEKAKERLTGYIQQCKNAAAESDDDLRKVIKERRSLAKAACDAEEFAFTNSMILILKIAEREDVSPESGKQKYGDVTFADAKNKKYPIDTAAHIRAAWNYINKPKNAGKYSSSDAASIKAKIVAAWKSKIDPAGPPSAKAAEPATSADPVLKDLGYSFQGLAQSFDQIRQAQRGLMIEARDEGGDSADNQIAARLGKIAEDLAGVMADKATHEAAETANLSDSMDRLMGIGSTAQKFADLRASLA